MFPMVESNHDEERLARIEQMLEALQRESAALKIMANIQAVKIELQEQRPVITPRRRAPRST